MKKNMGTTDRIIRILLAAVFAVLFFTNTVTGTLGYVLLALGAIFLLTSLVGFCPLYAPFGLTTCRKKETTA
jgi:Na+/phosphate symporter